MMMSLLDNIDIEEFRKALYYNINNNGAAWTFQNGPNKDKRLVPLLSLKGKQRAQFAYNFLHNFSSTPLCKCGKDLKFNEFSYGYRKTCSDRECVIREKTRNPNFLRSDVRQKARRTIIDRFGSMGAASLEIKSKMRQTLLEKTGFDNSFCNGTETRKKIDELFQDRYGGHPLNNQDVRNKIKDTLLERYGSDNINSIPQFRQKSSKTRSATRKNDIETSENVVILSYGDYVHKFMCKKCNNTFEYTINIYKDRKNDICPFCYPRVMPLITHAHEEIAEYLKTLGISKIEMNYRRLIFPLEVDIYLPEHNIAIEYCGLYWHSEIFKDKKYHFNKFMLCSEKNIRLITIFENDWKNKKEIIKKYLKNILMNDKPRLGARLTTSDIVDKNVAKKFLNDNHIQGNAGTHFYGLFYNNELISIASFSKKRVIYGNSNNSDYELVRYSSIMSVFGGLSKLIEHARRDLGFNTLISFSDLRFFNGSIYNKVGFEDYGVTIGYGYFDGKTFLHRYTCNKSSLLKKAKMKNVQLEDQETEKTLAQKLGLVKVFDCGQKKFMKKWNIEE